MTSRTLAFLLPTCAALLALAGCSVDAVGEAAQSAAAGAARSAACVAIDPVADQVSTRIDEVVSEIAVDPEGAASQLQGWRDAAATAAGGVDGAVGDALDALVSALDPVLDIANRAAQGATVTPEESARVGQGVRDALAGVVGECD